LIAIVVYLSAGARLPAVSRAWPHVGGLDKQRALEEWLAKVPHLELEFLFYGVKGHFCTRVHHQR